jgi:hypothetical protein
MSTNERDNQIDLRRGFQGALLKLLQERIIKVEDEMNNLVGAAAIGTEENRPLRLINHLFCVKLEI